MDDEELSRWFDKQKNILETGYLAGKSPWQQSGFGLRTPRTAQDWEVLRRPIADCITRPGTFLDIGCANGYLLECILLWTQERSVQVIPYGLDFSEMHAALARQRLPLYADNIFVGNAWDWLPPQSFDYVNSTLDYVPYELREAFVQRLLDHYVKQGGFLLIAEYSGRRTGVPEKRVSEELQQWGFSIKDVKSSALEQDPLAQIRVAVLRKEG